MAYYMGIGAVSTLLHIVCYRCIISLHVLFNIETPLAIPTVISDAAIKAAINLVDVCIQHAAFLAGRGDIDETVQEMMKGK